ncbi:MAG: fumarylacetoacetate hydrolase family protein [Bradymonadaceae bacterium]|nr:fumarylacetoacetate hydrolase family protein [Lujinxingiaceae bacterium]
MTSTSLEMIDQLANVLWHAQAARIACAQPSAMAARLSVEDAYAIQSQNIARRMREGNLNDGPTSLLGYKIGLTSKAIQSWLGVDQPDFGTLLDEMLVYEGFALPIAKLLQPRAEAEVAFVLKRALRGPGVTCAAVMAATDFVLPAIEIIDSRIADWKITYADTIADNASSGMFVLGNNPVRLRNLDLRLAGMTLRKNGAVVATGAGAACLNHPINAVVWLANTLGRLGVTLEPGHVILSGALGPVTPVESGDWVEVDIAHLGRASVHFS